MKTNMILKTNTKEKHKYTLESTSLLEKITGKNDNLTPLQFLSIYCHPDFSIFPPKTNFEVELRLDTRIV